MVQNLRGGRLGWAAVALAGPLSNLFLAAVSALLYRMLLTPNGGDVFGWLLAYFCYFNLVLLFLNLLPIPPFDGRAVVSAIIGLLSPRSADLVERAAASRFAFPVVIVMIFFTPIGSTLGNLSLGLASTLLGPG
jgi:Zn-dependent protease